MKILIALLLTLIIFPISCSKAKAGGAPSVEKIYSTHLECYLIRDEEGKAVGGTCL